MEVLDQASIDFTATFYRQIFSTKQNTKQTTVCEAFKAAKRDVEFKYKSKEADIFQIFTAEQIVELDITNLEEVQQHVCEPCLIKP